MIDFPDGEVDWPVESWEVPYYAVGIGLPDGEGVVDVPDVNDQIIVSNEHSLGSQIRNRVELVVQGIRLLSERNDQKKILY